MIDFLIKSTLSLVVLLAVYHLALEKEKMHQFNRFYLLFSMLFSFAIPFITIEVIQEVAQHEATQNTISMEGSSVNVLEESTNYWLIAAWSLYGLVTLTLLFRFILNVSKLNAKTKSNPTIDYKKAKLVLLQEETLPYTFLNSIFINKTDYHHRKIEAELFTHELIHVSQKHTLDILFIETLKVIFWFNPIFVFYKKAIQLNHEFLADEKVVKSHNNIPFYQNLLLSKANANPTYYLASNLNYSVTKKRLIMMTKTTSTSRTVLKKLVLIPVLTGLTFLVCVETVAQEKTPSTPKKTIQSESSKDKRRDTYYAGVQIIVKDPNKKILIDKKYEELTLAEKTRYLSYIPSANAKKTPTEKEFQSWKNEKDFAIWFDGKNIPNSKLDQYTTKDIAYFSVSFIYKNARTKQHPQLHQLSLYSPAYFDKNLKDSHLKFSGKKITIILNKKKNTETINKISNKKDKTQPVRIKTDDQKENKIHNTASVNEKPNFPGGMENFFKFVAANFKIPQTPDDVKLKGKVYVTFIVEVDGSLNDFKILRDISYGTGEEAVRVLKLSPKWTPGKVNGEAVRTMYSVPITIQSKI